MKSVPVPSQEISRSCICVWGVPILPLLWFSIFFFGTALTMWYFFHFINSKSQMKKHGFVLQHLTCEVGKPSFITRYSVSYRVLLSVSAVGLWCFIELFNVYNYVANQTINCGFVISECSIVFFLSCVLQSVFLSRHFISNTCI